MRSLSNFFSEYNKNISGSWKRDNFGKLKLSWRNSKDEIIWIEYSENPFIKYFVLMSKTGSFDNATIMKSGMQKNQAIAYVKHLMSKTGMF